MRAGSSCPRCGCQLDHGGDQRDEPTRLSVEALLDEIEQLRATVARLRGSGFTAVVAPVPTIPRVPGHP
jgi:hypothetical protein